MAKKSIETGEDCDAIPDSMRYYLAMHPMDDGKGLPGGYPSRCGLLPYGGNGLMMGSEQGTHNKVGMNSSSIIYVPILIIFSDSSS